MTVLLRPPRLTAAEFERLPDHKGYELVDGQLREKGAWIESSEIQSELSFLLKLWVRATGLGKVYGPECMYRCFPHDPERVRKPDVSFVRLDRLPDGRSPTGMFTIRPDFAAEVLSPNDKPGELDEKLADYESAGIPLVWVLDPVARTVQVRAASEPVRELTETDMLSGDPVLPGFSVRVADLFPPPTPARPS